MNKVFLKGSIWRHKNTGVVVSIREELANGSFKLRMHERKDPAFDPFLLRNEWTAQEMLDTFELQDPGEVRMSSWDRILLDDPLE